MKTSIETGQTGRLVQESFADYRDDVVGLFTERFGRGPSRRQIRRILGLAAIDVHASSYHPVIIAKGILSATEQVINEAAGVPVLKIDPELPDAAFRGLSRRRSRLPDGNVREIIDLKLPDRTVIDRVLNAAGNILHMTIRPKREKMVKFYRESRRRTNR